METGAIVAVTTHSGEAADTTTVRETVIQAGFAVADLIAEKTPEGKFAAHPEGVEEVMADKGYHSNGVMVGLAEMEVRSYIAEPDRGAATGMANRRRRGFGVTGSRKTSRISSIPAGWTGFMCEALKTCTRNS